MSIQWSQVINVKSTCWQEVQDKVLKRFVLVMYEALMDVGTNT